MPKIKTSELSDAALDWAVCMALGKKPKDIYISYMGPKHTSLYRRCRDENGDLDGTYQTGPDLLFSRKWESGGPIIEREGITISKEDGCWSAYFRDRLFEDDGSEHWSIGENPLIAAMRCYVASKLGDEVNVPEELL